MKIIVLIRNNLDKIIKFCSIIKDISYKDK